METQKYENRFTTQLRIRKEAERAKPVTLFDQRSVIRLVRQGSVLTVREGVTRRQDTVGQTGITILAIEGEDITIRFSDSRGVVRLNELNFRSLLRSLEVRSITSCFCGESTSPILPVEQEMNQFVAVPMTAEEWMRQANEPEDDDGYIGLPEEEEEEPAKTRAACG